MQGNNDYLKWSRENAGKYWVPTEPCTHEFATSPWEGEFSYNNLGKLQQYRNGEWVLVGS